MEQTYLTASKTKDYDPPCLANFIVVVIAGYAMVTTTLQKFIVRMMMMMMMMMRMRAQKSALNSLKI